MPVAPTGDSVPKLGHIVNINHVHDPKARERARLLMRSVHDFLERLSRHEYHKWPGNRQTTAIRELARIMINSLGGGTVV